MRILYDPFLSEYKSPFGVIRQGNSFRIALDIPADVGAVRVEIIFREACTGCCYTHTIDKIDQRLPYVRFFGDIELPVGLYFYYFVIYKPHSSFRLFKQGHDTNMEAGDLWQVSVISNLHGVPEWAKGAVIYQIFPDRFCKSGTTDTDGKIEPWTIHKNWDDIPYWRPNEHGEVTNSDFFGGNLKGIQEKIPYLKSLGVTIIYLNPIFKAWSNHRYDTADYMKIDPLLGTEDDFVSLCDEAHKNNIKIVLDGVFSHVGDKSSYFQKAITDENSNEKDWFFFRNWPNEYECWWNFKTLPFLNKSVQSCSDFLAGEENGIVAHWLKKGADGWRLDVADELTDEFISKIKNTVRKVRNDAFLIGEVWEDASKKIAHGKQRRYFIDNELDSVMNYPFRTAILDFCSGKDDGRKFAETLENLVENYPADVLESCMTFLSTHDTARALTVLQGGGDGSREEQATFGVTEDVKKEAEQRFKRAVFLQFMLPGAPTIYYGDEVGLDGGKDPFCRKPYPWGRENGRLLQFHKAMAQLVKEHPELKSDRVSGIAGGSGIVKFERGKYVICCNFSRIALTLEDVREIYGCLTEKLDNGVLIHPDGFIMAEK